MKPKALTDNDYKFAAEELNGDIKKALGDVTATQDKLMKHLTNSSVGGTFQKEVMH